MIKIIMNGIKFIWKEYKFLVPPCMYKKYFKELIYKIKLSKTKIYDYSNIHDYNRWLYKNKRKTKIRKLSYNPLISVNIEVTKNDKYIKETILSIINQIYKNIEINIVSKNKKYIGYIKMDSRINFNPDKYKGEYIYNVICNDVIDEDNIYLLVQKLNEDNDIEIIYTDEDEINENNLKCNPHLKPDFSPDTLISFNYINHSVLIKKELLKGIKYKNNYELYLKITEKTQKISHIPIISYHNRKYLNIDDIKENKNIILNTFKRRNISGKIDNVNGYNIVNYKIEKEALISIIIPTRDCSNLLDNCLKSIYNKTTYKNYEIIVVNNNSKEEDTFELFDKYINKYNNFKVIDANIDFNYSKINNIAVKEVKGEYLVLLNSDTELITPNWLEIMIGYASQKHIGSVGVKLLYKDNTIQHCGVVMGVGGIAQHAFKNRRENDIGYEGRLLVPYNYSVVTAACLMISKRKYAMVGGLEEELKVSYNDIDFNLKLLNKNLYNVCLPQVCIYHLESKVRGLDTSKEKYKRHLKEEKYIKNKWNRYIINDPMYNENFSKKINFILK